METRWVDETLRGGFGERAPRTWSIVLGDVRLAVTEHVTLPPGTWLAKWEGRVEKLRQVDVDGAKLEALGLVRAWATRTLHATWDAISGLYPGCSPGELEE